MLLRMTWMGMPVHYHDLQKWGYLCLEGNLPEQGYQGRGCNSTAISHSTLTPVV